MALAFNYRGTEDAEIDGEKNMVKAIAFQTLGVLSIAIPAAIAFNGAFRGDCCCLQRLAVGKNPVISFATNLFPTKILLL